jgi:hypothetical protein
VPEPISKKELELIEKRGGQITTLAKIISIPALEAITQLMLQVKIDQAEAYTEGQEQKMAKMDELIKALESKEMNLGPVVKIVSDIKAEHTQLIADFNAHKEHCRTHEEEEEHEPCAYKMTGKRDRRGFIDLEYGLTFTPVKDVDDDG